jgi:class 3 adenylate cyclase
VQYSRTIKGPRPSEQSILTILFTDIERSVAQTQRLGDIAAQSFVRAHNTIVRQALRDHHGAEVKHTGDGIMATFGSAAHAVACALAVMEGARQHNEREPEAGLRIRIGLNAGEPVAEDADLFGTAVQLASRACDQAEGGQIMTTDVVRQLVAGRGFRFRDCGEAELKGFNEPVRLWEVSAAPGVPRELPVDLPRWFRRVSKTQALAAGAPVILVCTAAAITGAVLLGASRDGTGEPAAREVRLHIAGTNDFRVVGGDCVTSDVTVQGTIEGRVTGDLVGEMTSTFEARIPVADECRTVRSAEEATVRIDDGDTFTFASASGAARLRQSQTAGSGSATVSRGAMVITGGTGAYDGATGSGLCTVLTLADPGLVASGTWQGDCTFSFDERPEALSISASSPDAEIAERFGSSSAPSTAHMIVIYRNNTDAAISGVTLRLPAPEGAEISATADDGTPASSEHTWNLGDLAPGAVSRVRVTVRLLSARDDTLDLAPEISAEDADSVRSEPLSLVVIR